MSHGEATPLTASFFEHRAALERFVRARLGRDAADLDDIMQETWLRIADLDALGIVDTRSYLFRLTNNLVLEWHRRTLRGRRRDADWMDRSTAAGIEEAAAERTLLARERLELVAETLDAVGDRPSRILRRFRLDGIGQRQIAAELGVSLSTVEKELRKAYDALAGLKRRLDEE